MLLLNLNNDDSLKGKIPSRGKRFIIVSLIKMAVL